MIMSQVREVKTNDLLTFIFILNNVIQHTIITQKHDKKVGYHILNNKLYK